jgi:hypothetical protein
MDADVYRAAVKCLRRANRVLGPVSDRRAVIEAIDTLAAGRRSRAGKALLLPIRSALEARRARQESSPSTRRAFQSVALDLMRQRGGVNKWDLEAEGFRAIARGLERVYRRGRRSMRRALKGQQPEAYHTWRLRVKDQWYHVRLLRGRSRSLPDEQRLAALDACLGEQHNLVLLRDAIAADRMIFGAHAAACVQLADKEQRAVERRARRLAAGIYREKPLRYRKRLKRHWRAMRTASRAPGGSRGRSARAR